MPRSITAAAHYAALDRLRAALDAALAAAGGLLDLPPFPALPGWPRRVCQESWEQTRQDTSALLWTMDAVRDVVGGGLPRSLEHARRLAREATAEEAALLR